MMVSDSEPKTSPCPIHGEYDLANASELATKLHRVCVDLRGDVILDCEYLRFWDSSAISVLVDTQRRLRARGRDMRLINLTGSPRRVLEILGIAESFGVASQSDNGCAP
jgi:anti-anti-sigma factor